jgi:mono/diheme cytochrome c family protein
MWFTSIQVSPQTIGLMVDEFHWIWATEWIFFWLEVVAGYAFFRYREHLAPRARLALLAIYSVAGWGSLFWINGILSWQLTPGAWTETHSVWDGFFNPTFWPSLLFRTVVCLVLAGLGAAIVINAMPGLDREDRTRLINRCSYFLLPMLAMPILGGWFVLAMPADSRSWIMGGSMTMTMFLNIAAGASALIGGYAVIGLWRQKLYINGATATLLAALAFGATAGGEFVREGVRKPYSVRETLYSNATTPGQIAALRQTGVAAHDPYPLRDRADYPTEQLALGRIVYGNQCAICHTVAKLQWTKGFMPPVAGTPAELEAVVQYVAWEHAGRPAGWAESSDPSVLADIARWLAEAGTAPAPRAQELAGEGEVR